MSDEKFNGRSEPQAPGVGLGYPAFQIAKALRTAESHPDSETRARAKDRVERWCAVIGSVLSKTIDYGSRSPLRDVPVWATPEVVTGGFATGRLMAGGTLRAHEIKLMETLTNVRNGEDRSSLNGYHLSESGFARLSEFLNSRRYDIEVPEEGALLIVAWLAESGHAEAARHIIDQLAPYFERLRFYPVPLEVPRCPVGTDVHLQTVGQTASSLTSIRPNEKILAQKESVNVWTPFHDRVVALFLETVVDGSPCRHYAAGWFTQALGLLDEYKELRSRHKLSRKPDRPNQHYFQLRELLKSCATESGSLPGRDVDRVKLILAKYQEKRGDPGSPRCLEARKKQAAAVAAPTFHAISAAVVGRLFRLPQHDGFADVEQIMIPVTPDEAAASGLPAGTVIPQPVTRRMERCLNGSVEALVSRGLITSGDTLAALLPQLTSGLRSTGFADPRLQDLYGAIYRAFRRRRSLLLLNLQKQIQLEELPWISAIEPFRSQAVTEQELSKNSLQEITVLTLTSFPHAIIPNKLLQEMKALAKGAKLELPLVEEVAADIFMGTFSGKFLEAAKRAAKMFSNSLYSAYYRIDCAGLGAMGSPDEHQSGRFGRVPSPEDNAFATLCASRANVALGGWDPVTNGMVIEQQQIITTQNLAVLFDSLGLSDRLREELPTMAKKCFTWICHRQQSTTRDWHARLIVIKNTAYAWRQMMFFLSCAPTGEVEGFVGWAEEYLRQQPNEFQIRFRPALNGLSAVATGGTFEDDSHRRRFLGWSKELHWLLPEGVKDRRAS